MQSHNPKPVTSAEWNELAMVPTIRQLWGLDPSDTGEDLAAHAYGARFDFVSGGPGYCGDLFIVYGDALSGRPALLKRNDITNKVEFLDDADLL